MTTETYTHDGECPHGRDREDVTANGLPKCPPCRRRAMYELRTTRRRPTKPRMTQPALIPRT